MHAEMGLHILYLHVYKFSYPPPPLGFPVGIMLDQEE